MEQKYNIFVCYSRKDLDIVRFYYHDLQMAGLKLWFDMDCVMPGDSFDKRMVEAISNCSVFLFFHSQNANESHWMEREVHFAKKKGLKIVPVKLDNSDYTESLKVTLDEIHYINHSVNNYKETLKVLISVLGGNQKNDVVLDRLNKYDIFISYSRKDSAIVNRYCKILKDAGLSVWIDENGIETGDEFKRKIVRAIKESTAFLFFSSMNSNNSPWTVKEVNVAVELKKKIIPVKLDATAYEESILFDLAGLDYMEHQQNSFEIGALKLLSAFGIKNGLSHLHGEEDTKDEVDNKVQIVSKKIKKVFISYAFQDYKAAEKIAKVYEALNIDVFYDIHQRKPGKLSDEYIKRFIHAADTFILCWSKNAENSKQVAKELKIALPLAYPQCSAEDATLRILPYNIQPYATPPKDMIEHYHFEEL